MLRLGASVEVVKFFEMIVDWNRKVGFESEADRLSDPRVVVKVTDVVDYFWEVKRPFDAILLDVDSRPDAWCLMSNQFGAQRRSSATLSMFSSSVKRSHFFRAMPSSTR